MDASLKAAVEDFIARERLPATYLDTVEHWFLPLTDALLERIARHQGTFVLGISGSQGSGKSTLGKLLVLLLELRMGLRAAALSIDDFYLTRRERLALADKVHPLFATRGVPGTHDVDLAVGTIEALKQPGEVAVPRFDKAMDDRADRRVWQRLRTPLDVVILEGWCLCVAPEEEEALAQPVNDLEAQEDGDGVWRRHVNARLGERYPRLHALIDYLIMLKAPNFEQVYLWRQRQEDRLAEREGGHGESRIMTPAQLRRFIQHYERLTRHALDTLPARADVVFALNDEQGIDSKVKG